MAAKPRAPLPTWVRRVLRRILPERIYLRYVGRHEKGSLRLWQGIVRGLPPGATVLDIGAFRGSFALAARSLRTDLRIVAFEPNPAQHAALRAACEGRDILVEPVALADRAGVVHLRPRDRESCLVGDADVHAGEGIANVTATTLDAWARDHGDLPLLISIDVEGAEAAVLCGGRETLTRARPILLCEVLTDEAGRQVAASLPERYRYFEIDEDRGIREAPIPTRKVWRHYNWLLVPEERRAEIDVW